MKLRKLFLTFITLCLLISCLFVTAHATESTLDAPVVKASNSEYSGKVQLSWTAVDGAVRYKVYRCDSADGKYLRATTTTATSFVNSSTVTGKTYYYYVVAEDASGAVSAKSNVVSRTCDLPRPSITLSSVESTGKIKISWEAIDGAAKYEVYRSTDQKNWSRISTTTKTAITNTGAVAGTTYYYKVRAVHSDTAANSAYSAIKSQTCDLPRPVITGFSNSEYSGKIIVEWEAVSGAVSYNIYRADSKNGTYKLVGSTAATSFTNSSTEAGKTYYYKVRAVAQNTDANSAQSAANSHICKLPRPSIKLSSVASTGKIKISWEAIDGAVSYKVYRSTDQKKWSRISTTTKTAITNTSAVAGTTYYYKVLAVHSDTAANSAYSAVKSRTCDLPRPSITGFSNSEYSGKIIVEWEAVSGAVSYNIYRADSKNGTYKLVGSTAATSFTNSSTEAGKTYYYKVRAVAQNTDANSAQSAANSHICKLPRPSIKLSSVTSTGKVKISWESIDGAAKYEVYRSTDQKNWSRISTTTKTSVINKSAVAGTTYYYKVRAVHSDTAANSAYSAVKSRICKLPQPELTLSNDSTTGYVQLSWEAIDGAAEYRVYRSTAQDGAYSRIAILEEPSFTDSTGCAGVTYYYKVIAYADNTDGNSAYSGTVTGSCPYMTVCITLNEDGDPRLTWNGVEGAESYAVYRSMASLDNSKCIATTQYTSLTNSGAASGITYHYTVCALDANGDVLYKSDNRASITTAAPANEVLETNYVSGILLSLYDLPDSTATYTTVPYMTQVQLGAPITTGDDGVWYRVFHQDQLCYVWIESGEKLFTTNGSTFTYTSDNPYQQEVIDYATYIALNWKTVYEHDASKGEMKEDGTYGFDCSGFVRYVMNTVMQQYVPTYKIVAEIEDLVVTESIYNEGYPGAFSAYEVTLDEIQPGDVIFFSQQSTSDHCGIYLGNGEFVHSSNYWENSVCISPLIGSYVDQISVIRRYLPDEVTPANTTVWVDPHNKDGSTTTQCKLYAQRSTTSEQLCVLQNTDTVTVLFTDSDLWAYVCLDDGTCGYILTRNLGSAVIN